jgi:hypothetical protein
MATSDKLKVIHRRNEDDTIDSICRECFATIATERSETELDRKEHDHVCDPWVLERFQRAAENRTQ